MRSSSRTGTTTEITPPSVPRVYRQRRGRVCCPSRTRSRACCRASGRFAGESRGRSMPQPAGCSPRTRSRLIDLPRFPSSAMDGFALRGCGHAGLAPGRRARRGRPAGPAAARAPARRWESRREESYRTGPTRSCPIELVEERDERVVVPDRVDPGANVRDRAAATSPPACPCSAGGDDAHAFAARRARRGGGRRTRAAQRRPRVAIVTTGTELRPAGRAARRRRDLRVERRHARRRCSPTRARS